MFLTFVLFVFIQKRFLETAKDGTYAGWLLMIKS